ncbi:MULTISPECIES: hypothetical protein [unclassified Bacillus (in: firmicutes)]|uniref:Uncharacterized protein n=1 Tax=Bacillus bruguierae TaxID=3127667 RepID=A0ABU8FNH1_9BACI|nr:MULTISPECIES: hypothetical protein [unclassified Bacillus (in: firmicutes)]SFJ92092.1 hypothetical protein SAMN04488574_1353 [Bacillus sp. 71mf]SFS98430.1 hypothetical protein SAMN04488145_106107 [Bacillus sp. 103mf]
MSRKQKRIIMSIIGVWLLIYILLHRTPTAAIRTEMFLSGNPKAAMQGKIERMGDPYDGVVPDHLRAFYGVPEKEYENYRFPEIRHSSSSIDMSSACVRKRWFLYYAELGCF